MSLLVTGCAGFIGMHATARLLAAGQPVVGLDNLNDYYDVGLKRRRLARLEQHPEFRFLQLDLADRAAVAALFAGQRFDRVLHLAAQAGVRYSLEHPHAYIDSNIVATLNLLEGCRHAPVRHLVFASSSSVYGLNTRLPFSVHDNVDHPVSLYAATKKANELMAHAYAHLYGIPTTGLRFFTVYGPWGRPDMALFRFTEAILSGQPIDIYNEGRMQRDFTYIDDIVEGVVRVLDKVPGPDPDWRGDAPDPGSSPAPYRIYNIGHNRPVALLDLVDTLERALRRRARRNYLPMQPGDVAATCADIGDLEQAVGFRPRMPLEEGVGRFVAWYRAYYGV
jgi:UDP-glucuronate 4-epimerase